MWFVYNHLVVNTVMLGQKIVTNKLCHFVANDLKAPSTVSFSVYN